MYDDDHYFLPNGWAEGDYKDDESYYESKRAYWHDLNNPEVPVTVVKNPVMETINRMLSSVYETQVVANATMENYDPFLPESWARSDATWRRMMHSQPGMVKSTMARFEAGEDYCKMASIRFNDYNTKRLGHTVDELVNGPSMAHYGLCDAQGDFGSEADSYVYGKLHLVAKDPVLWEELESSERPVSEREALIGEATKA